MADRQLRKLRWTLVTLELYSYNVILRVIPFPLIRTHSMVKGHMIGSREYIRTELYWVGDLEKRL